MTKKKNNIERRSVCPSCGTEMLGIFCYNCGEKRTTPSDYMLSKFIKQSIYFLTHFDSKLFQTTRLLVTRPGFLTKEYFEGRRIHYVKPLQLFFLLNILFFIASSFFSWPFFSTPLQIHLNSGFYKVIAKSMVDNRIHELGISYQEYESHFNHTVGIFSKTLIFIMIPFMALLMQGLYWRPRRFYVEHLVYSIHFFAFTLLNLICVETIFRSIPLLVHHSMSASIDFYAGIVLGIGTATYLFFSMKVVYRQSLFLTGVKTVIMTYMLFWVLWGYRVILFFTCFYFS